MKIDTDTDEGKAELQKLIDAATDGLKAKNAELLGDMKKQKTEFQGIKDQLKEIQDAKDAAEAEAAAKGGDVEKVKQQLQTKYQKEIEALNAKLSAKDEKLNSILIDGGLTEALAKANIAPQYMDAARALVKTSFKAEVVEADGKSIAQIDGKPITEFVTSWSQGDQGKHFVAAQNNSGGGANGSNGGGKAVNAELSKLSPVERLTAARESQAKQ